MLTLRRWPALFLMPFLCAAVVSGPQSKAYANSLVFGSFSVQANAEGYAGRLRERFLENIHVYPIETSRGLMYRVATGALNEQDLQTVATSAENLKLPFWRQYVSPEGSPEPAPATVDGTDLDLPLSVQDETLHRSTLDFDLGMQTRGYAREGADGQDQLNLSFSARMQYYREWDDGFKSFTFTPFVRYDGTDNERTHFDIRELFYSTIGEATELHVGARQIFWGVTEFHHLVDVINQTDLVENIDGEDKLGQPMVQLSLLRDYGVVEFFLLAGFRERTFPGPDGRLRLPIPIDTDRPIYESSAGNKRMDGAIRWSHTLGPTELAVYHFSGTNRDPQFVPEMQPDGELVLRPRYTVIDQTGLEALTILGDWALKLEAITRSGDGDRYAAFTTGVERTFVGAFGGRGDVGIVVEYMFDERDELATNTLFEHDIAFGTRWRANDVDDTEALFGLIWDVESEEYVVTLEASRRLGETWTLFFEGRAFAGGSDDSRFPDQSIKTSFLQRDDFIQLELTRYF
jgi:hypothetical protein